jgi:regulator of sigma E protease
VTSILAFIFVLGVLIFVHELGHFLMARRIGVRVLTFSLGFGPKLVAFRRGDTEYCISAIPLGGYVKMAGETSEDSRTGAPDEFLSKSKWQRFQVLVMGPVMNLVLAVIVMAGVLYQGAQLPAFEGFPVEVGGFLPNSVGQAAGLQTGDRIISVDGRPAPTWKHYYLVISTRAGRTARLEIERNGQIIHRDVVPKAIDKYDTGDIGILPIFRPQIGPIRPSEPAAEAGLRTGDRVLKAAGEAGVSRDRLIELIKAHEARPLLLEVAREDGKIENVTVTPRKVDGVVMIGAGIYPMELTSVNPGALESVKLSLQRNWEWSSMIFETLGGLFTRGPGSQLDSVVPADGDAEPQSRHPEPDADSSARRRSHHDPRARGRVPARLQHQGQGEDAPGRLRPARDVDGHRHLQRFDAHPVD